MTVTVIVIVGRVVTCFIHTLCSAITVIRVGVGDSRVGVGVGRVGTRCLLALCDTITVSMCDIRM